MSRRAGAFLVELLAPLVDLLSDLFGPNCEVVLHDFSKSGATIVKIRNGHVTGRTVGGTVTDLGLDMLQKLEEKSDTPAILSNYRGHTNDGRDLKCASFVIRHKGKSIGALCINIDITPFRFMWNFLDEFCRATPLSEPLDREESFVPDFRSLLSELIDRAVKESGKAMPLMSKDDKLVILKKLEKQGAFLLRGAVREVSRRLGLAPPTIYKYLSGEREAQLREGILVTK